MATRDSLIQVKNLKKHYNHGVIKALDDVSVDINKGDVMVVIGPSGSGKSTFLRSLNLLEEPTGGEIIFDGIDITKKKYEDENGKTNRSLQDVDGEILVVSQFTLYADCRKGNRPSFVKAGKPEHANALYEHFVEESRKYVPKVEHGSFGADMQVELGNEGPFTLVLTNEELGF